MKPLTRIWLVSLFLSVLALYMGYRLLTDERLDFIGSFFRTNHSEVLFVGDVMLARSVESRIRDVGEQHFFDTIRPLHERAKYIVGNFEAVIPEVHSRTPNFTFQFSVDKAFMPMLARAGFTHFSLANNHANDYGAEAQEHTASILLESGFTPFGSPSDIGTTSVTYIESEGTRIALIAIQTVIGAPNLVDVDATIATARNHSDIQVVVVHWGEEYQLVHNSSQEQFATHVVKEGADAVIGHHPHVVQDIGNIDGVPVFYSLGNYVFDQYFNNDVQTGLTLLMRVKARELYFTLIPVRSNRSVLNMMTSEEERIFFEALASRSDTSLRSGIVRGVVQAEF